MKILKKIAVLGCLVLGTVWNSGAAGEAVRLYDFGADEMAYLALPDTAPRGSILLIPDALGVPEVAAKRCELLAKLGFVAMTVDLYNGQRADTVEKRNRLQARLRPEAGTKTIRAALNLLTESPLYQSDRVLIGVWGANMDMLRQVLADPQKNGPWPDLVGWSPRDWRAAAP
ncbi:MAG: hypothetical protein HC904_07450 [Blastochloris sp.]|nr:hypothetical protein [Blastochloris sp.]